MNGHWMNEPDTRMERIYLYVPPEEYPQAQASGACWDDESKRWYTHGDPVPALLSSWMGDDADPGDEVEFAIASDAAFVASAQVACVTCGEQIDVICIYCESGTDVEMGDAMTQFTLSNLWAMDAALIAKLERWPHFKNIDDSKADGGYFANHCPHCGSVQEDYLLHAEAGDVFFCIPRAEPDLIQLTPLVGTIRASGDYSFGV